MKYTFTKFSEAKKAFRDGKVGVWAMDEAIAYTRETHFLECLEDATYFVNRGFMKAASLAVGYAYDHMATDWDTRYAELDLIYEFQTRHHIEPIVE